MKPLSLIIPVITVFFACQAFSTDITWIEKAQNPAYFPYKHATITEAAEQPFYMDNPIPPATNRSYEVCSAYQATDYYFTNIPLWSESDPMYGEEGYWPCYRAIGVFANGKYYIGGGSGPNVNLSGIIGRFRAAGYDADQLGYRWPSNTYGYSFSYNRQSGFAIYDLEGDSWNACKWDETGPVGYNYGRYPDTTPGHEPGGTSWPQGSDGSQITANQAFAFDVDDDGTEEIFLHGGYPHWGGYCAVYDPDENEGNGSWSKTSDALNFTSGYKAQYGGGAVRITSNIWCIGGVYWGPDTGTHMQRYNVPSDSWEKYENVHPQKLDSFGVAAVGSKIYMMGGYVGRVRRQDVGTATNAVFMLDTDNIGAGVSVVGRLAVPVADPAVISWKGVLYLVGGETDTGNYTNLFQIFNPLTGATVVHEARLPVNAAAPSCAVTPDGQFLFGGAMRIQEGNQFFNSSRLWTAPLPEQDMFVAPTILDYWQDKDTLQIQLDNVTGLEIVCTVATTYAWLDIPNGIVTVGADTEYVDVDIDRSTLNGPTNGLVTVTWGTGNVDVQVSADTPRPVGSLDPTSTITLQPKTKQYMIYNGGAVPMNFTNTTTDAFIANITPQTGTISPLSNTVVSFDVTAAAPRPGVGTIDVTYNSYDGEVLTFTVNNYPSEYYVATDGDNGNDGLSWTSAWATIAYGINNVPNGSAEEGSITLNIGPGTYEGECTDSTGTNWFLDLTGKSHVNIMGAGAAQTILTKGNATWQLTMNNDLIPDMPVVKIDNADNLRFSGMAIQASDPPALTDGTGYPEHCAVIGLFNCENIQLDHLHLDGKYTGMVYNTDTTAWQASWVGWWYHAIVLRGVIGPGDVTIDHVLSRGFERAIYNNNFGLGGNDQNVNFLYVDHCTFVEAVCPSDSVQAVVSRVNSDEYGPSFIIHNSIIADIPWTGYPGALSGQGLTAQSISSLNNFDFTVLSQSNQYYSVGLPIPGSDYVNENVVQEDEIIGLQFTDYTNEPPEFFTASGLPYSTDYDTDYGYRDVGWNPVPEPGVLAVLLLAVLSIKRIMN